MSIRLYWPNIAPNKFDEFLPSINKKKSYIDKYFETRIWVHIQGEDKAVSFNSETFLQRHPEIKKSDYIVQDDDNEGLRKLIHKKHPEKRCSYALDKNIYTEFCGGFSFYYKPKVRVAIGDYGWPSIKDINGNPPTWQDIRQGIIAILDRYHEV